MYKVTFQFENNDAVEAYAKEGENLLEVARKSNVAIDAPCSGNGSCGKCRIKLISGEFEFQEDTPYYRRGIRTGMAPGLLQHRCR